MAGFNSKINVEFPYLVTTENDGIRYEDTFWDDLRFPATRIRQGATQKPDFDTTNLGLLFPQNDTDEIAYIIAQMPHQWKQETNLSPHVHFVQDEAEEPVFKIDYRWYKNGSDPTGEFTTIACSGMIFEYTSGSILQMCEFPAIDAVICDDSSSRNQATS